MGFRIKAALHDRLVEIADERKVSVQYLIIRVLEDFTSEIGLSGLGPRPSPAEVRARLRRGGAGSHLHDVEALQRPSQGSSPGESDESA
jgi:hypothetical protein